MDPTEPQNEDYSPSSTVIPFHRPVPILRGPIADGPPGDRSFVLAFTSPQSWAAAYAASVSRITQQCEDGARIACAVSASDSCKPPWWRNLVGPRISPAELREREACEVREMESCLVEAKKKCAAFARDKCRKPFLDARIAPGEKAVAKRVICLASLPRSGKYVRELRVLGSRRACSRARELLGPDAGYEAYLVPSS